MRLIEPKKGSKDQRWYIRYYRTDPITGARKVAKDYSVNKIPLKERLKYFNERKSTMTNLANLGYNQIDFNEFLVEKVQSFNKAIEMALKVKTNENIADLRNVRYHALIFNDWSKKNKLWSATPEQWNKLMIASFSNYIKNTRSGSARTINNYMNDIRMLANTAIDCGFIEFNPVAKFWKKLKNAESDRVAFLPDQQRKILDYCDKRFPGYALISRFMYYTLCRPKELFNLKFSDLHNPVPGKIRIQTSVIKTRNSKSVVMPKQIIELIDQYHLFDYPKDWYIFSHDKCLPGTEKSNPKTFGYKYTVNILRPLGFSSAYKFYSWKDTGFITLHMSGVSPGAIRQQAGHRNQQSFDCYTRSMGLWDNPDVANRFPSTF